MENVNLVPEWTDAAALSDSHRLKGINVAIYVMRSEGEKGLFRSGVIGVQQQNNNAFARLRQLNAGDLKHRGPWEFAFLAPLPGDLGPSLATAEKQLQSALAAHFDVGKRGLFTATNVDEVLEVAGAAAAKFLDSMQVSGTAALELALRAYCAAIETGHPRDNAERARVIDTLRMCLDGGLARSLLEGLQRRTQLESEG